MPEKDKHWTVAKFKEWQGRGQEMAVTREPDTESERRKAEKAADGKHNRRTQKLGRKLKPGGICESHMKGAK